MDVCASVPTARYRGRASGRGVAAVARRAMMLFVLFLSLVPRLALADPELDSGRWALGNGQTGYVILNSPNAYQSTLCLLGFDFSRLVQIDNVAGAKLSNPETGGMFYTLMQRVRGPIGVYEGVQNVYVPQWLGGVVQTPSGPVTSDTTIDGWNIMYPGRNWVCECTDAEKQQALQDLNTILDGGDVGGGGGSGGGSDDDESYLVMVKDDNGWAAAGMDALYPDATEIRYYMSESDIEYAKANDVLVYVSRSSGTGVNRGFNGGFYKGVMGDGFSVEFDVNYNNSKNYCVVMSAATSTSVDWSGPGISKSSVTFSDGIVGFHFPSNNSLTDSYFTNTTSIGSNGYARPYATTSNDGAQLVCHWEGDTSDDGGDTPPPLPDNNWPDTDDGPTPDPPSPPDPGDPVSPNPPNPPNPGDPIINPPPEQDTDVNINIDLPDVTVNPTGTTPQDYTPWLRAILEELRNLHNDLYSWMQDLLDALASHCLHIRQAISEIQEWLANSYLDWQETQFHDLATHITNVAQWLGDSTGAHIDALAEYLGGLAEWIVDSLQWQYDGGQYDDSSVLYWLRAIYTRLASGNPNRPNTRPSDPATEFDPWGEWLRKLWEHIMDNLLEGVDDGLGDIAELLNALRNRFPFSIPWDLYALLVAFGDVPTAPVIEFTMDMPTGIDDYEIEIDMSPYDTSMETVRDIELICFVVYVIVHGNELFAWKREWF